MSVVDVLPKKQMPAKTYLLSDLNSELLTAGMPRIFTALKPCQSAKSYTTLDLVNVMQRGRKGTLGDDNSTSMATPLHQHSIKYPDSGV